MANANPVLPMPASSWRLRISEALRRWSGDPLLPREHEVERAPIAPRPAVVRRTRLGDEYRL